MTPADRCRVRVVDAVGCAFGGRDHACLDAVVAGSGRSGAVVGGVAEDPVEVLRFLQQTHGPVLLKVLTRLTGGDVHRAEDIVEETLLRVWRDPQARQVDGRWSRAYIFAVARGIVVDQVCGIEARPREFPDGHVDTHAGVGDPTQRVLDRREVGAALGVLPERLRRMVVEVYFRDRPVSEVAEILGVPVGTVMSWMFCGESGSQKMVGRGEP